FFIHGLRYGLPPTTRGRSPVRESRTPGSARGVSRKGHSYRNIFRFLRNHVERVGEFSLMAANPNLSEAAMT
ncbi:hypothetical protein, partial [Paraburkholderia panacisoli]|uniref:hypothetical protein n=1 Tax=Paraburkholderia panacisoli TaxID=2603818 RepID=UPI001CB728A4